jgi:hypothetical protein
MTDQLDNALFPAETMLRGAVMSQSDVCVDELIHDVYTCLLLMM